MTPRKWTLWEERANAITHLIGLILAPAALAILVIFTAQRGTARLVVSCAIYGASLVTLYLASTLYHSARDKKAKRVLRVVDHVAIYLLIAGTYTPFLLVNIRGAWGWSLFGVMWGLAAIGIVQKALWLERWPILSVTLYVAMGWLMLVALEPFRQSVPDWGIFFVGAGGMAYTLGVIFFALDSKVRFFHAAWHVMVLAGSILQFFAVLYSVVPDVR